jgi:glycopeptide antibiotics resistance protein
VCFTITFVIEIVQYIFKVGMLDVDDILLCVAGMMSFYYFYGKYRGKNKKRGM